MYYQARDHSKTNIIFEMKYNITKSKIFFDTTLNKKFIQYYLNMKTFKQNNS